MTVEKLLEKALNTGYVYDTGGQVSKTINECTANGWLLLREGGRYYITKTGGKKIGVYK